MRLDKYLSDMGCGTRSEIRKNIRAGRVSVGEKTIRDAGFSVQSGDEIRYLGEIVRYENFSYYMMNKPQGVISASEDRKMKTVVDLIDEEHRRKDLFPVGRLDRDTEGLLLITNDGQLAHRLLSPKKHVDKQYFAKVRGRVTGEDAERFAKGITIDGGYTCMPAELAILESGEISSVSVIIREGKFHQIKKMFEALGKEVVFLKRLRMGSLVLDPALSPGEYRRLTEEEINAL